MPHGGECAFNGVGGPQVLPMLSREVVKRQQRLAVLRQATHRLVVLDGVGLDKGVESGVGVVLRLGHPDVLQSPLGLRLQALFELPVPLRAFFARSPMPTRRTSRAKASGTESLQTLRWREMDSNFQFRVRCKRGLRRKS